MPTTTALKTAMIVVPTKYPRSDSIARWPITLDTGCGSPDGLDPGANDRAVLEQEEEAEGGHGQEEDQRSEGGDATDQTAEKSLDGIGGTAFEGVLCRVGLAVVETGAAASCRGRPWPWSAGRRCSSPR